MFLLKPVRFHGEIRKGFLITRAQNVLINKDLISKILCKIVYLVYQKLNETKSFLDFALQTGGFKWNTLYNARYY
jgi:hypothetical protein